MKKYVVYGKVSTWVCVELEAEDKEDAIERAYDECSSVMAFVGNGGIDKIIGVCDTDTAKVSINCDDEIEYTEVEEIDEEE